MSNVLRLKPGAEIEVFDGHGNISSWEIGQISRREAVLSFISGRHIERKSPVALTLGINPLKSGNEETAIRMAAAMEVHAILPVFFSRSDVPFEPAKFKKRLTRWVKIAAGEAAQSKSAWMPEFMDPVEFDSMEINPYDHRVLFYEDHEPGSTDIEFCRGSKVIAVTGPEGGITPEEIELGASMGLEIASLGPWTLRAELASSLVPSWVYGNVVD